MRVLALREDEDYQRCEAGVAAKMLEFSQSTPYSGYTVVDVLKLHHAPMRSSFLAAAHAAAYGTDEAPREGAPSPPSHAAAKVKGLFCGVAVASVQHISLHGFGTCASPATLPRQPLTPQRVATGDENAASSVGAHHCKTTPWSAAFPYRKRWCIGEELAASHARLQQLTAQSPPPPLPVHFWRHSTLQVAPTLVRANVHPAVLAVRAFVHEPA